MKSNFQHNSPETQWNPKLWRKVEFLTSSETFSKIIYAWNGAAFIGETSGFLLSEFRPRKSHQSIIQTLNGQIRFVPKSESKLLNPVEKTAFSILLLESIDFLTEPTVNQGIRITVDVQRRISIENRDPDPRADYYGYRTTMDDVRVRRKNPELTKVDVEPQAKKSSGLACFKNLFFDYCNKKIMKNVNLQQDLIVNSSCARIFCNAILEK